MLNQNEIGTRIAIARKLKNFSQAQLAEQLAVSAQAVGKWERGESMPDIVQFARLATALGTDVNYFVDIQAAPAPSLATAALTPDDESPVAALNGKSPAGAPDFESPAAAPDFESPACAPDDVSPAPFPADVSPAGAPDEKSTAGTRDNASPAGTHDNASTDYENPRPDWDMSKGSWVNADFSGLSGLAQRFSSSNIDRCRFVESELDGLVLKGNSIQRCDFSNSNLRQCSIKTSHLGHSNFSGCDFGGSEFKRSNLTDCNFSGANLTDVVTKWVYMKRTNLSGATLYRTVFTLGQLTDMTFTGTLTECTFENCDFSRVIFDGATLINCFFKNSKLRKARFVNCKTDSLTYAFIKNCKADMAGITIIEEV